MVPNKNALDLNIWKVKLRNAKGILQISNKIRDLSIMETLLYVTNIQKFSTYEMSEKYTLLKKFF